MIKLPYPQLGRRCRGVRPSGAEVPDQEPGNNKRMKIFHCLFVTYLTNYLRF